MSQNYKDTINLPRTDFPMKANLAQREPELLKRWEEIGVYRRIQKSRENAELFVLHDGPPFANGDVHMGTALNKILKDFVVKSQTMLGKHAPYVPGWDCHGLPIEYKVVKESRDLAPLEVRKRCEVFARKFIDLQREQFKRLGVFGDWDHPYLTMNPTYEAEILRAFAVFVEKGLVYESKKPVFWSTGAQTALAEAEVEYQERDDTTAFVKFPVISGRLKDKASIAIWTTTPWTLPANLLIAVHPKEIYVVQEFTRSGDAPVAGSVGGALAALKPEPRSTTAATETETLALADKPVPQFCAATGFQPTGEPMESFPGDKLEGIGAQHPFLPRTAMVLTAEFVTMDTGTGAVHIAPGHGEDDYLLGSKNGFPILSPVDDHGRYTNEVGIPELVGKYVFDANADIIRILRDKGMLLAEQNFHHTYPYCWRSKTPIIFRAVEQFFIRLDEIRGKALDAIHHQVKWVPSWGENRIAGTVESRPDWVISRQRSWGVPLPVFYAREYASAEGRASARPGPAEAGPSARAVLNADWIRKLADLVAERGSNVWFELSDAELARELDLPQGTTKRNDTIDVWIDSGVSHRAVCATHPELRDPADMYREATDQHRGWFQSSLMTSIALNDRAPYKMCLTHGFVVDLDGKKISKSGTYDKPMDAGHFVKKHGADLIRLWASSINFGDDVPFSEEMFTRLGDTYRRIRNTLRILLGNLFDYPDSKPVAALYERRNQDAKDRRSQTAATKNADLSPGRGEDKGEGSLIGATSIDRWILDRLDHVISECRNAYAAFEFHKVYHSINHFCAVDLSSLYIDITKDRMYCDAPDSPRRRATQFAMHKIFDALCRLLAPVLVFTAEEAWGYRRLATVADVDDAGPGPSRSSGTITSVHLELFPKTDDRVRDSAASHQIDQLLRLRGVVGQALEKARQEKLIGNSLEARVTLKCDRKLIGAIPKEELEEFFILSDLIIEDATEPSATVEKTPFAKCARCWRHRESVGQSSAHPDLCDRCEGVVASPKPEGRASARP
ncbi:MAG: isoleucine--tRNA ligase [Verrucomicrobia bacterium]|nr:MAG: isoleucine--tRNA ligase [Verrucomicrobiota bacterium]